MMNTLTTVFKKKENLFSFLAITLMVMFMPMSAEAQSFTEILTANGPRTIINFIFAGITCWAFLSWISNFRPESFLKDGFVPALLLYFTANWNTFITSLPGLQ